MTSMKRREAALLPLIFKTVRHADLLALESALVGLILPR